MDPLTFKDAYAIFSPFPFTPNTVAFLKAEWSGAARAQDPLLIPPHMLRYDDAKRLFDRILPMAQTVQMEEWAAEQAKVQAEIDAVQAQRGSIERMQAELNRYSLDLRVSQTTRMLDQMTMEKKPT